MLREPLLLLQVLLFQMDYQYIVYYIHHISQKLVVLFQMDEYLGLSLKSPQSFTSFLFKEVVIPLGIKKFHFEDDNISLNKQRFENILDRIIEEKLDIQWDTPNGIRADTLDFNILKKIKKSGCRFLRIAIESGNQRVLDQIIHKNSSLKYVGSIILIIIFIRTSLLYLM